MSHMVSQVLQELAGTEPAGQAYLEIGANYSKADLRRNCSSPCLHALIIRHAGVEQLKSTEYNIHVVLKDTMHTDIRD